MMLAVHVGKDCQKTLHKQRQIACSWSLARASLRCCRAGSQPAAEVVKYDAGCARGQGLSKDTP